MVQHDHERVLVFARRVENLLERHVGIAGRLERHALMVAEPRQLVELGTVHRAHDDAPRMRFVAYPAQLVVLVRRRRRQNHFRGRAPSRRERLLDRIASIEPFAAGDEFPRPFVMIVLTVCHILMRLLYQTPRTFTICEFS